MSMVKFPRTLPRSAPGRDRSCRCRSAPGWRRPDFFHGIRPFRMPPTPMMGSVPCSAAGELPDHGGGFRRAPARRSGRRLRCRAAGPPRLRATTWCWWRSRRRCGVCSSRAAICVICSVSRSGAIFTASGTYLAMLSARVFPVPSFSCVEQRIQFVAALQLAQVLGVGRGDVDGDVAGVGIHLAQADQVIVGGFFDRRVGVLADVDAEDAADISRASRSRPARPRRRC